MVASTRWDPGEFDGKTTLTTGGNSSIGLATAKRIVQEAPTSSSPAGRKAKLYEAVKQIGSHVTGVQGEAGKPIWTGYWTLWVLPALIAT
jgi:NAD(P)-dependent dehydrogenase (short-subunit alcohol dehydrogenase family)